MNHMTYVSAFGRYRIPYDVYARSLRLEKFGRTDYLKDWCKWQWMNGRNGDA